MDESHANPSSRLHSFNVEQTSEASAPDNQRQSWSTQSQNIEHRRTRSKSRIISEAPEIHDSNKISPRRTRASGVGSRRAPLGAQTRNSTSQRATPGTGREKESGGFFPKLGRILEGRESEGERRRNPHAVRSKHTTVQSSRRTRSIDEGSTFSRRSTRTRRSSAEKNAEDLANLIHSNPSLASVFSSLSSVSSASSGSNSTVTQKSYDRSSVSKRKKTKDRRARRSESRDRSHSPSRSEDQSQHTSGVFQYMQNPSIASNINLVGMDEVPSSPPSVEGQTSPKPHWKDHDGAYPSPPSSVHLASDNTDPHGERLHSDSGISVRGSSPDLPDTPIKPTPSAPSDPSATDATDEDSDSGEEESDSDNDESSESDEEEQEQAQPEPPSPNLLEVARAGPSQPPPEAPPNNELDEASQRMQSLQEQARHHMFQSPSPQPHFDGRFMPPGGALSPQPQPLYVSPFHYLEPPSRFGMSPAPLYHPQPGPPPVPALPQYTQIHQAPPFPPQLMIDRNKVTIAGYELVAQKLSASSDDDEEEEGITPVYRKFESLNHRILLHLQDEISEQEEELRFLDESIAQMARVDDHGNVQPMSRRADARYGSDLHFRRTELLGRIYLKLGQYNQALSSFQSIKAIDDADEDDVEEYAAWLEQHAPVDRSETQFLNRPIDLLRIKKADKPEPEQPVELQKLILPKAAEPESPVEKVLEKSPAASSPPDRSTVQAAAFALPLVFLLPVLALALVPGTAGRILVMIVIGVAEVAVISSTSLVDALPLHEWALCGSLYFALMACLAALIR